MITRLVAAIAVLVVVGGGALWWWSAPRPMATDGIEFAGGDPMRGQQIFLIGGCASCHGPDVDEPEDRTLLEGGKRFATEFGTFVAPNISPHPEFGIGDWTAEQFLQAMMRGISPDGDHYYPAFPYGSYARMEPGDVVDLWAYMQTLPVSDRLSAPHNLAFPYSIRRSVGVWKRLYLDGAPEQIVTGELSEQAARGQYLVEGPGHCAECHTARDALGGLNYARWMGGAPKATGDGRVPNITPGDGGIDSWSEADIASYLATGFTPDYDVAGGDMVEVIENTSRLTDEDRGAIASYLKVLTPVDRE